MVDELDQLIFHLSILLYQVLIEGLALIQESITGFENSGAYSSHKLADLLIRDYAVFIFVDEHLFLRGHSVDHLIDSEDLLLMLDDLILDKELIILVSLLGKDLLVVLEKFEVRLFSTFKIPQENGPVVIEVSLKAAHIFEVHLRINIL